jgi:anti-sigma regulatory factor (Ser/Thr protein kinase)
MTVDAQRAFRASMQCLPGATAFVEGFCDENAIAHGDALRLTLIVEELFTNTVVHGHGGDSDAPVRIELTADPTRVTLSYEDAAPPFDPLARLEQSGPDLDADLDDRPVGGLGIVLIVRMATSVRYAREDGFNRLHIVLQREG